MNKRDYKVKAITRKEAGNYFLHGHYLKKWPRISFLFGLFLNGKLVGAISYGTPSSPAARGSVAGKFNSPMVLELNRLFLENNLKNEASFLISNSIKLLPKPRVIISYADNGLFREFRHSDNKLGDMKKKYGKLLTRKKRSPKSRFYLINASPRDKKRIEIDIRWKM